MISEFSKKIYAVVLSAALIFSVSAGSFGMAYALDEAEEQQTEETEPVAETESETPQDELTPADDITGAAAEEHDAEETPEAPAEKPLLFKKYKSRKVPARDLGVNLKTYVEKGNDGYVVAQGAATDGTYAYFLMVCTENQKGRVVKTTLDGKLVKAGPVIETHHGNDMTYNSRINKLVIVGCDEWRHELSFVDPEELTISYKKNVSYPFAIEGVPQEAYDNGIAGIAYIPKYNVYLARSRGYIEKVGTGTDQTIHNIWVFDADSLTAIAHIDTEVFDKYPDVWQSMDADEKYVYYLLSPIKDRPSNIILCLDWNSENLEPVLKGEKTHIRQVWSCNDNGSGEPDAVMTLPFNMESEGIFHTASVDEEGKVSSHFYVSEYQRVQVYKTIKKKVPYKVKWKKVKKKVKWKKVKGKWKYKTKKVWKYKTKYKTVKQKVKDYKQRDDSIYDLGVL